MKALGQDARPHLPQCVPPRAHRVNPEGQTVKAISKIILAPALAGQPMPIVCISPPGGISVRGVPKTYMKFPPSAPPPHMSPPHDCNWYV